ncbi:hypothetical protein E4U39_002533, partial [Claviceps sp. Clav50 group G5]
MSVLDDMRWHSDAVSEDGTGSEDGTMSEDGTISEDGTVFKNGTVSEVFEDGTEAVEEIEYVD